MRDQLEKHFPNLLTSGDYKIASSESIYYNCVAWAAGDTTRWWWPSKSYYWPPKVPREETVRAFIQAFETLGYEVCDSDQLEDGFEKVALYADDNCKPTHMARQLKTGVWTSKLGRSVDIEHSNLSSLEGGIYGHVEKILKRRHQPTISSALSKAI